MKILLTSTSFQDTPGKHHDVLNNTGYEIDRLRGPLKKDALLPVIDQYDGIICSDDEYDEEVIEKGSRNRLKVISKYGIGLDSIDLKAAEKHNVKVVNCSDVNHVTVAEHVYALLLTFTKNIHKEYNITRQGNWDRMIGEEIFAKKMGILGLGKIGKEVAKRAVAFGMEVVAFDEVFDYEFANRYGITCYGNIEDVVSQCDILSLHLKLTPYTKEIINNELIENYFKKGMLVINTARGKLINLQALILGLESKVISAYLTDVLEEEPMQPDNPLLGFDNVIITPHIGSRTYQSVERQGTMAVQNLIKQLI